MSRNRFRERCVSRDGGECIVPTCEQEVTPSPDGPGEVHHIMERKLWEDGGYFPANGASVCNPHHRMAEDNIIPPQAFWRWADVENPVVPVENAGYIDVDKWGEPLPGFEYKW